jgi:hypothetical protein
MPAQREIYIREPEDPNYKDGVLEINDEVEILITQLKMLILTTKGDILGAPAFGMSLEDLLFSFNANEYTLQNEFNDQLMRFCPLAAKYDVKLEVKFFRGTVRDIGFLDISINDRKVFGVDIR